MADKSINDLPAVESLADDGLLPVYQDGGAKRLSGEQLRSFAGMNITGATAGQIAKIAAVDENGKPTEWEAADMPISFKPAGKSYLTFSSSSSFTLAVNDATKHWDGTLEYFASDKTWTVWDGTTTLSAVSDDGEYILYLRGTGNTIITGSSENYRWVLTGTNVKCIGNIENLLDYATVASGEHPTMASYCYNSMFYGCKGLTQAPALPATTLAYNCYYYMFFGCTDLTQAPALPATTLAKGCYRGMFGHCTSFTQAPALPATTLAEFCYQAMFLDCTALTHVPALPAMTLANYCYRGMFEGCTSLKLSSTQTGEYTQEYRIPSSGDGVAATDALADMFTSTGGTFTGTPSINTTYYFSSDNMIVRETEVDTLNGYVGSMIDVAIAERTSNPLNITGATVGQIAKITAVDDAGKPTEWEAADMPSGGGHWETVLDTVWEQDVINPTAFDSATGIFTCASGELNNLELNKEYAFFQQCTKEGAAYNTILSNENMKVTKLSDTTFSIDVTPPATFVPTNVKFSRGACLAITDIDAKKIRLTLDGQFKPTATPYDRLFYGTNVSYFGWNTGYVQIRSAYHAYQQATAEVESPYRIVGEILCGFNAPSQSANFHFKNNSFCSPLIPYNVPEGPPRNYFLTSDGTKIAKLYSTQNPWHLGGPSENLAIGTDFLRLISGTKVKLERWVE